MIDIPHPVVEPEMHGRLVLFDEQPAASIMSLSNPNWKTLTDMLWASRQCAGFFSHVFVASDGDPEREEYDGGASAEWATTVSRTLRLKPDHRHANHSVRHNPNWSYFQRNDLGITAFRLTTDLLPVMPDALLRDKDNRANSQRGVFVDSGGIRNFVPASAIDRITLLCRAFGLELDFSADPLQSRSGALLIPSESHLFCVTSNGLIALECECGRRPFLEQRRTESTNLLRLQKLLLPPVAFHWARRVDHDRFEQLLLEIIMREDGVSWVRKVGHSSASDAERDLVADWYLGPAPWQHVQDGVNPYRRHRVVIQCKAYSGAVNLRRIPDVPKILDLHDASAFHLVAYPTRVTPQVVDYLNTVPARRGFRADWWTQTEIEERLRNNLEIARRYPDIVKVISSWT